MITLAELVKDVGLVIDVVLGVVVVVTVLVFETHFWGGSGSKSLKRDLDAARCGENSRDC